MSMVLILKKGADKATIAALEKKLSKGKPHGFNAKKYNGVLKLKGDALDIQKKLRSEWSIS
jgi:hypothetical protein